MNDMEKTETKEAFVMLNHSLYHALLIDALTMRELKTALLILRLTIGCQKKWAKVIQADFMIIGIKASHAKEILTRMLDKHLLLQNEKTGELRLNDKYFQMTEKKIKKLERLSHLIGKQIYQTSLNGNSLLPKQGTSDFPIEEPTTSQSGNIQGFPKEEVFALDNFNYSTPKDNDKNNIKHNIKENNVTIDSYKRVINKVDPRKFVPQTVAQECALEAWKTIEPDKPDSFNFYLWSAHKGLPPDMFDEFTNDVLTFGYENPGAMFVTKVKAYLEQNNLS